MGPDAWSGPNYITKKGSDPKLWLNFPDRQCAADALVKWGIVQERPEDWDIVLFNQPLPLHKLGILTDYVLYLR